MILKIDFAIKDRPWFPAKEGRAFTEFEARIDYLMLKGAGISLTPIEIADRWKWTLEASNDLVHMLETTGWCEGDWYIEEDTAAKRRAAAMEIIGIYKEVFNRKVIINDSRIRLINARIAEGKKFKQTIGPAQFRAVFEYKRKEWMNTEHEKYLTLETLCAPKHFANYLEAAREDYKKQRNLLKKEVEGFTLPGKLFK